LTVWTAFLMPVYASTSFAYPAVPWMLA
jgi:hypothetical protein